jgi:hypothetical protein
MPRKTLTPGIPLCVPSYTTSSARKPVFTTAVGPPRLSAVMTRRTISAFSSDIVRSVSRSAAGGASARTARGAVSMCLLNVGSKASLVHGRWQSLMAERSNSIRRAVFTQYGGPGSDLLISLFVGLPLAIGAMTLLPRPLGVVAVIIVLAVIALHVWEGQKTARLNAERQRQRELRHDRGPRSSRPT